jgi:hypothetical protein
MTTHAILSITYHAIKLLLTLSAISVALGLISPGETDSPQQNRVVRANDTEKPTPVSECASLSPGETDSPLRTVSEMKKISFCPMSESMNSCLHQDICKSLCSRMRFRPIDTIDSPTTAVHFVGFRGEELHSARRVWGNPDFYHRVWDRRAIQDIAPCDIVVFAKYDPESPSEYSFDDSNQPDDPAAKERRDGP